MSDLDILNASAIETLKQVAGQARGLGTGLQEAAPAALGRSNSVEYLFAIEQALSEIVNECEKLRRPEAGAARRPEIK